MTVDLNKSVYPFRALDVGNSFFIPHGNSAHGLQLIKNANRLLAPKTYEMRWTPDDETQHKPGVRV